MVIVMMMLLALLPQQPQKPQTDVERLAALQLSKECRDAGDKFWQHGGYANQPGFMADYLTHYNRQESKCFIRTVRMMDARDTGKTMFMMIFDAVEGSLMGSKILRFDGTDYVTVSIDSYDGVHKHDPPTPSDKVWFDDLMTR